MVYQEHFELWPVFIPATFELTCIIFLTSLKTYFDVILPKRRAKAVAATAAAAGGIGGRAGEKAVPSAASKPPYVKMGGTELGGTEADEGQGVDGNGGRWGARPDGEVRGNDELFLEK